LFTLHLILIGLFGFAIGVGILGIWLRKHRSKENAEKSSRIAHFLFFAGVVTPPFIGIFYPGLTHFDELAGIQSLPLESIFLILGIILAVSGLYFLGITNKLLRGLGRGANAFRLTKQIVAEDIYKRSRNPMSLGFYLLTLAMGFISGSSFVTLVVLLGLIPAHIFFLRYFEELELELRFGESYLQYKKDVPFLIPKFIAPEKVL